MRALLGLTTTLILVALIGGCASSPSAVHVKEGMAVAGYEQDEKHCKEVGHQAMMDYGKGAAEQSAAGANVYSDPKHGPTPAIAATGATSFMSGLEKGKAKGA